MWKNLNTYRSWSLVGGCQGESGRRRQTETQTHVDETQIRVEQMETRVKKIQAQILTPTEHGAWLVVVKGKVDEGDKQRPRRRQSHRLR